MKNHSVIKVLLFSIILMGSISCGSKKNKKGGTPPASPTTYNPNGTTSVTGSADFNGFKTLIQNGSFLAQTHNTEQYYYYKYTGSQNTGSNCEKYLAGLISVCSYSNTAPTNSSMLSRSSTKGGAVQHEFGTTPAALIAKFMEILNGSTFQQRNNNSFWAVKDSAGNEYGFDLGYPLAANPVFKNSADGTRYVFYYYNYQ